MLDPSSLDTFRPGQVLNNTYEIQGLLGSGGTSEVYRAANQITGRVVAIKVLKREHAGNAAFTELMKREEEMRSIVHDAVVRYTDCNRTAEGHVYLVMDYVDGTPLSSWLERGRVRAEDLVVIARRVCEGLVATHAGGVVHRDLSPDNVILRNGRPEEAVIIDFGIARDTRVGARTLVGQAFAGKYEYAAPEQLAGSAGPAADLYALGATLLAVFRGKVPEVGENPAELLRLKDRPLDTEGVPEPLRSVIDRLAAPDPDRRPRSAAAALVEIDEIVRSPGGRRVKDPRKAAARPYRVFAGVAGAIALAAVAALLVWGGLLDLVLPKPLPVVSPYTLAAARGDSGRSLSGHAPDDAARQAILAAFATAAGSPAADDALTIADGAPTPSWGADVAGLLARLGPLDDWRLEVSDRRVTVSGVAPDTARRRDVADGVARAAEAAGLDAELAIAAGPRALAYRDIQGMLASVATCGPLAVGPPAAGEAFALGETVAVSGFVGAPADVESVSAILRDRIGDRTPSTDLVVLDPDMCALMDLLPVASPGPVSVVLGWGDRPGPNSTGIYAPGENPTIDVLLPADVDGHLWVAALDVGGRLFNILPTASFPDSRIPGLGTVAAGVRTIRVAHSLAESAADNRKLSIIARDDSGKSMIIAFTTDKPLFDGLREINDTAKSFGSDLLRNLEARGVTVRSISTAVLDTRTR